MSDRDNRRNLHLMKILIMLQYSSFFVPLAVPFWTNVGHLGQQQILELQAIFTLTVMVLELPTGVLSDQWGRRKTLVAAEASACAGFICYALAEDYTGFVIAEIVIGIGLSLMSGTVDALRHETVRALGFDHANAELEARRQHAWGQLGAACSSILSGLVLISLGYRYAMLLDAALYFLAAVVAFILVEPRHVIKLGRKICIRDSFGFVRRVPGLVASMIAFGLLMEATHFPVFFRAPLLLKAGLPEVALGIAFAVLTMLTGWLSRPRKQKKSIVSRWAVTTDYTKLQILMAIAIFSYMLAWMLPTLIAPLGLVGLAVVFAYSRPLGANALNKRINTDEHRATINSMMSLFAKGVYVIGGPLLGWVADTQGIQRAMLFIGLGFVLIGTWPIKRSRRLLT